MQLAMPRTSVPGTIQSPAVRVIPATNIQSSSPRAVKPAPQFAKVVASTGAAVSRPAQVVKREARALSGPESSKNAYEAKHAHDEQLANLKQVRKSCGLKKVGVLTALAAFKAKGSEGKLTRADFLVVYESLLNDIGHEPVSDDVKKAVFDLFDRDDNDVVDMMELVCGVSLLCKGSDTEKIEAVFQMFDENGDGFVTADEMFKFLTTVFKVVCTPNVMELVKSTGVDVESAEDMASATTLECFKFADLNHDGRLSLDEFKKWFGAPRAEPGMLFTPLKDMLN
jgi:Ca2+-binding EF-hand superfamily protein